MHASALTALLALATESQDDGAQCEPEPAACQADVELGVLEDPESLEGLDPPAAEAWKRWPALPFTAWVNVDSSNIRAQPTSAAPVVGLVHRGDLLSVTGCVPGCDAPRAWALLGTHGAIRLDVLALLPEPSSGQSAQATFLRGLTRGPWTRLYREPNLRSRVVGKQPGGRILAFLPDEPLRRGGWLRHVSGAYVPAGRVVFPQASRLRGEFCPAGTLALLRRDVVLRRGKVLRRYTRLPALALTRNWVELEGGRVPRASVALAFHRPRPEGVGAAERWVHVDVREQVLTAYEGDQWVYATLVSTGKVDTPTDVGRFRVWAKIHHTTMRGTGKRPYLVEAVPDVLSFHGAQALHGAFWHDGFGAPASHGCINLAPRDAEWLFAWAPPQVPAGWHTVLKSYAGKEALTVVVEDAQPGEFALESRPQDPAALCGGESVGVPREGEAPAEDVTLAQVDVQVP